MEKLKEVNFFKKEKTGLIPIKICLIGFQLALFASIGKYLGYNNILTDIGMIAGTAFGAGLISYIVKENIKNALLGILLSIFLLFITYNMEIKQLLYPFIALPAVWGIGTIVREEIINKIWPPNK